MRDLSQCCDFSQQRPPDALEGGFIKVHARAISVHSVGKVQAGLLRAAAIFLWSE